MTKIALQKDIIKLKGPPDKVLELINWIEVKEPSIVKWHDSFDGTFWLVTVVFISIASIASATINDFAVSIGIFLAGFSGLMAYYSFFLDTVNNRAFEKRFGRVKSIKTFGETDIIILRALLKIKSKNEDLSLKTLYLMDKEAKGDIFTEKRLIELLCNENR
jgi:hypothetical protein